MTDVSISSMLGDTASGLGDGMTKLFDKAQDITSKQEATKSAAEKEFAQKKYDVEIQQAQLAANAAKRTAGGEIGVYKKYDKELMAPPPTIQYSPETAQGMQSLAILLPIAGALLGGQGQLSGIGAMQAMSGVLEGHRQGNQDRIALETKNFEQQMQNWKLHMEQVKGAFDRALQMAKINGTAAQQQLKVDMLKLGAPLIAAQADRDTVVNTVNKNSAFIDKAFSSIEQAQTRMYGKQPIPIMLDGQNVYADPTTMQPIIRDGKPVLVGSRAGGRYGTPLTDTKQEELAEKVSNYTLDPKTLSVADRDSVITRAAEINPEYDQRDYGNTTAAARYWQTGKGADKIGAFSVAAQHIQALSDLGKALRNGDVVLENAALNKISVALGHPEVTNFDLAKQVVADEIIRAVLATGGGVTDRDKLQQAFSANASPQQIEGAIGVAKNLIGARVNFARNQFKYSTKKDDKSFNTLLPTEVQAIYSTTDAAPKADLSNMSDQDLLKALGE
jgi:hypothetical protein